MSALPSTPSTRGWASAVSRRSSIERRSAIDEADRPPTPTIARAVWSAATMNSRPSVSSGRRRPRRAGARRSASGSGGALLEQRRPLVVVQRHGAPRPGPRDRRRSAWRRRTAAGRPRSRRRRCRSAAHSTSPNPTAARARARPPKASPAPSPHTTSTGYGRDLLPPAVGGGHQHPVAAELDDGRSSPRASRRSAASCGSAVPTATSHSARLPMATVACPSARTTSRDALAGASQSCGR